MNVSRRILCALAIIFAASSSWGQDAGQNQIVIGEPSTQESSLAVSGNTSPEANKPTMIAANNKQNSVVVSGATKVAPGVSQSADVLSFIEWKSSRVHEAQRKLEQLNQQGNQQQLTFNVDVALQLNIQDYFSMYLKNLDPTAFKAATKKLSDDEVSELLTAYKNHLEKGAGDGVKLTKSPKIQEKSKN